MENELSRIVDALPGLVWSALPDGRVTFVNRPWFEYTGATVSARIEEVFESAIHPQDLARWREGWRSASVSSGVRELELRLRRFDGAYRWNLCRACPLSDDLHQIVGWCGIISDIDDRRRAESVRDLTASITHEVNQPLSGIITNASTCMRMLDATPPNIDGARETARRTLRDGNRASEVIARLRALFSKKEFMFESLDLNEVAREVVALSSSDLRRHGVELRLELADDLPRVSGDRIQLQQVMLNLVRNALDAMTELHDRPCRLLIRTEREDADRVRMTVRDAGVGVDPASMDKLFDAFYTTKNEGMGVGLSVSRSIIDSHRGRIWATPNDESGATFAFSIPSELKRAVQHLADGRAETTAP